MIIFCTFVQSYQEQSIHEMAIPVQRDSLTLISVGQYCVSDMKRDVETTLLKFGEIADVFTDYNCSIRTLDFLKESLKSGNLLASEVDCRSVDCRLHWGGPRSIKAKSNSKVQYEHENLEQAYRLLCLQAMVSQTNVESIDSLCLLGCRPKPKSATLTQIYPPIVIYVKGEQLHHRRWPNIKPVQYQSLIPARGCLLTESEMLILIGSIFRVFWA